MLRREDDKINRLHKVLIINGVVLVAMMCGLCGWILYKSHEEVRHYAVETSQNIALIAQRDIVRNIEILSLSMDALAHRYQNTIYEDLTNSQKQSYLFGSSLEAKHVVGTAVLDTEGKVVATSLPGASSSTYGDRSYFTIQRDHLDVGLYISKPIVPKFANDLQIIVLSKRLSNIDGSFGGVVLMALDLNYFRDLFSGVELGENGVMSLYSRDGVVYMRMPYSPSAIGRDISGSPSFLQIKDVMQQDSGNFFLRAITDGVKRLYAFQRVPDTQLLVFIGRSEKEIYGHWSEDLYGIVALVLLSLLVCLGLFLVLRRELKKRVEAEEKLRQLSRIDGLTKLINRRTLDDILENLWSIASRGKVTFSVLFIDVDYFKLYNDTYGHQKGDDVLTGVASTIARQLPRSSDVAARYGGEEFVVLLAETDAQGAMLVGEKIRGAIEALQIPHSRSQCGHVTASIGVATYERAAHTSVAAVLSAADGALYVAKEKGRNRVQLCQATIIAA